MQLHKVLTKLVLRLQSRKGFTMIELLIVIAILGILAVAVLAAINPVEQINRGRDTGSRSDAEQLLGAVDRFYAVQGYPPWVGGGAVLQANLGQPWQQVAVGAGGWYARGVDGTAATDCSVLGKLSDGLAGETPGDPCPASDELKTSYVTKVNNTGYNPLFVYNAGAQGDSTYVCFVPRSGAFLTEAANRCVDAAGSGLPADLQGAATEVCGTAGAEMICLP